jgi:hypothetical protein
MKSLVACMVTLSALVACAGNVSLGSGADGLKAGEACSAERCKNLPVKEIGCPSGQPVVTCLSNGAGACSNEVSCPGPQTDAGVACVDADCGPKPTTPQRLCLDGSTDGNVCARRNGVCTWTEMSCPAVVPAGAESVAAINLGGGFVPAPPPGSACALGAQDYVLTFATKTLKFTVCNTPTPAGTPYTEETASKVLSDAEVARVKAAFEALAPVPPGSPCASDFQDERVEITSAGKSQVYYHQYSVCSNPPSSKRVAASEGVDGVFNTMRAIAGK